MKIKRKKGYNPYAKNRMRPTATMDAHGRTRQAWAGERLVECAIMRDGQLHHGFRSHSELRRSLGDENPYQERSTDTSGFYTSQGRFVSRREGNCIAAEAGQCPPMGSDMLSSDINWSA